MELLSISVSNQKCRVFQVVGHDGDDGYGFLTIVFLISEAFREVLQTHGTKQPKLYWPSTWPKPQELSYQYFSVSESLQSLFVFLFTFPATSFSCFLKCLPSGPHHAPPFLGRCKMCNSPLIVVVMNSCSLRALDVAVCNSGRLSVKLVYSSEHIQIIILFVCVAQLMICVSPVKIYILGQGLCLLLLTQSWVLKAFAMLTLQWGACWTGLWFGYTGVAGNFPAILQQVYLFHASWV